jgi:hypothetical protein
MSEVQFTHADLLVVIGELELTRRAQSEQITQLQEQLAAVWRESRGVADDVRGDENGAE